MDIWDSNTPYFIIFEDKMQVKILPTCLLDFSSVLCVLTLTAIFCFSANLSFIWSSIPAYSEQL